LPLRHNLNRAGPSAPARAGRKFFSENWVRRLRREMDSGFSTVANFIGIRAVRRFTRGVSSPKQNVLIAAGLLLAVALWGGSNAGTKWLVMSWPPIWTGSVRLLCAGPLLWGLLQSGSWTASSRPLTPECKRQLWLRGGLTLAAYMIAFNSALQFTAASHVALCLGAAPVWALLWEEQPRWTPASARRYGAALLAAAGVAVLFWPALTSVRAPAAGKWTLLGDGLGLVSSLLWAAFSRQIRRLGANLSGAQTAAHTMWMAGVWLLPLAVVEIIFRGLTVHPAQIGVQAYCIVFGAVAPYAIWNSALQRWPASRVLLFNNLIPLSTMLWAHGFLGEPITPTFWTAMALIVTGVVLGQGDWMKIFGLPESV